MNLGKIVILRFCWLICIAVLIAMSGCTEEEASEGIRSMLTPADLLPDDDDISSWKSIGAYEEANDYDELFDLINGGAEVFIDHGFTSAAFQIYNYCIGDVCTTLMLHLRIYDQGSAANAQIIYDKVAIGIGIPLVGAGTEARVDERGLASYMVEFWQRNFFVQVIMEEKTDEALNVAKLFASHVSSEIR